MNIFCVDHLPREIPVGYQTEHGVERVGFDVSTWVKKWPGMGFQLWASVPGTDTSYPAQSTRGGNILFWDVGLADTAVAGRGVIEVVGLADGVKKIARADTLVRASTTAEPGEVPEVHQPWVDQVLDAAVRAEEAAKRAEAAEGGGVAFGPENVGQLLYVGADGKAAPLQLGEGLEIVEGVLRVTYQPGPDVPADKSIIFSQQENGDVLMPGVTFVQQTDGSVLWYGANFAMRENDVLIN